jgi:hypothetical protein
LSKARQQAQQNSHLTQNWADFLRISPWRADAVRAELRASQVAFALAQVEASGATKEVFINIRATFQVVTDRRRASLGQVDLTLMTHGGLDQLWPNS